MEYPKSPSVVITHSISLVCLASGTPLPNITWNREGEGDIDNSSESRVVNATHVTSELTLVATGQQDTGQYNCLADNGIGTDNVSFYLQILGMKGEYVYLKITPPVITVCYALSVRATPSNRNDLQPGARSDHWEHG